MWVEVVLISDHAKTDKREIIFQLSFLFEPLHIDAVQLNWFMRQTNPSRIEDIHSRDAVTIDYRCSYCLSSLADVKIFLAGQIYFNI